MRPNLSRKRRHRGRLLNATLGNLTELVIATAALRAGIADVRDGLDERLENRSFEWSKAFWTLQKIGGM